MIRSAVERLFLVISAVIISWSLSGCGGGGGGQSNQSGTLGRSAVAATGIRSVRINNYNNWHFRSDQTQNRNEILQTAAQRDNITITELWAVAPHELKSINPKIKVYMLYTLMCKPDWDTDWYNPSDTSRMQFPVTKAVIDKNDWWLRDGDGNIIKQDEHVWMLDVGKPGFKEAFLEEVLQRNQGKGFDGFVFDYWWAQITDMNDWITSHPRPDAYPTDKDWFDKAWKPFIEYITRGLHSAGYRVIGNCAGEYNTDIVYKQWQRAQIDGVVYEQFAVDWPQNGGGWLPGRVIERRIDSLSKDPLEVWVTDYGLQPVFADFDKKRHAALAMYYVAIPANQEKRSYYYINDRKVFWDPLWDFNIGTPAESATRVAGKYFWSRKYTKGMVILNYESSESISFTLDRSYQDADGKVYSGTVTVPPHTGLVLATGA